MASAAGRAKAQTCRFAGATSYDGRLAITSVRSAVPGGVLVDVKLVLDAQPLPMFHTHYLMEEISLSGAHGLAWVGVNSRYRVDAHVVRQSWDLFVREPDGLKAWRIEGKRAGQFGRQHPLFAAHWDFSTFGQPWVEAFRHASPDRRADLDLDDMSDEVRVPLALAFDGVRGLPGRAVVVPVFLPGFKDRKRVDLAIGAAQPVGAGEVVRDAPLVYPDLSGAVRSTADAWLALDGRVLQLAFDLHGRQYGARATIRALGCGG